MPNARATEVDPLGVIRLIGENLIDRYPPRSILKELLQNADDAGAKQVVIGWTPGPVVKPSHPLLQGPALIIVNDGKFTADDAHAICRFGQNYKFGEKAVIGKFGLGLKSVFHLCEAFFYLSSTSISDDDELYNNLASPWANTEYHRGWNAVVKEDLELLRQFLAPLTITFAEDWFVLWLPLRRSVHCNDVRFSARYDGDQPSGPPELSSKATVLEFARALPLLNSVHSVQFWERWEPCASKPSSQVTLDTPQARSRFRKCVKANSDQCGEAATGQYSVSTDRNTTVAYALIQSWSSDLLSLTKRSDWPKSFVLTGGQQPDKAQPHAAVVLGRRVDREVGKVDVVWAVFLPLDLAAKEQPEAEFLLTLHGCFFVDSGRRHVLHHGEDVRGVWNQRLMSEGLLPLIVPAVESLSASAGDNNPDMVKRLTRALADWMANEDNHKDVCGKFAWIYRWRAETPGWERVESAARVLEIPDFGTDATLPQRAMPPLEGLAREFVLTPTGFPRLTASEPKAWLDQDIARAIEVTDPQDLFESHGSCLKYLHRYLRQHPRLETAATDSLLQTLRGIFSTIRFALLDEHRDLLTQIVCLLPASRRRALPLGGNWPENTRKAVCATGSFVLLMPDGFDPKTDPGTAKIPTDQAIAGLAILAKAQSPGRNTNPAVIIVQTAAHPGEVSQKTADLTLWNTQQLTAERTETLVCNLRELRNSRERCGLFIGPVNDWIRELAISVTEELKVVPADTAAVLFSELDLPSGDMLGVIALLKRCPPLRTVAARLSLLRRLLAQQSTEEQLAGWCDCVRYLLHGITGLPSDEDLFLNTGQEGVWSRLVQTCLASLGQPHRILANNELTRQLNPEQRVLLRIHPLDHNGVAKLLTQVNLQSLKVRFSADERDEVIRGLQDYPQIIRGLPLYDRVDGGGMTHIGEHCFWEGTGTAGSLARHITLLKPSSDSVLAAIQKKIHPPELTSIQVIRLALQFGAADHCDALLAALQSAGTLPRDLRTELSSQVWLPSTRGRKIAPSDVLHNDHFGEAVVACIRLVAPAATDTVPSDDLSHEVRSHPGFRELARQLFPGPESLIDKLVRILKRDARFSIGDVDLRTQDERKEWLEVFRDAPNDVMAASQLIAQINKEDPKLCVERLLPSLRDGAIPSNRLERIFAFLRKRHSEGHGNRSAIVDFHNRYLRLASADRIAFRSYLPRLQLLNEMGQWVDPATLCVATGLDRTVTLDSEQQDALEGCVHKQPVLTELLTSKTSDDGEELRPTEKHFSEAVDKLRDYFSGWQENEDIAGWAGAFLALLGDYGPMEQLSNHFLEIGCPGRTAGYVRIQAGMRDAELITERPGRLETTSSMMTRQRVLVQVTDPSLPLSVINLLGNGIKVKARENVETMLIGFGMDRLESPYLKDIRVRCLHLRRIKPASLPRHTLRDLLARTGELILRVFYGQHESQISFAAVLEEFSGDDAFGVRVAQESFLNGAQYALRLLGLAGSRHGQLYDLLRLADAGANRRSEEGAVDPGKVLPGRTAISIESEVRDRLRDLVSNDAGAQQELVEAVRRKVGEYRYEPRSMLFELFQNADDAYAERGCPADTNSVFMLQLAATELGVLHNGRPINRSPGDTDTDAGGYRHDLRKMLSLGHSDKAYSPAVGGVTGRFGLGFKSVFLVTDRPRVLSGRLAFEVVGGVYPRPIDHGEAEKLRARVETAGLPKETGTIFQLPLRKDIDISQVVTPFRQLAHLLVVFAKRIRSIRYGTEYASWKEQTIAETQNARIVIGPIRPLSEAKDKIKDALVIRCGPHGDVLFGLGETGFIPLSASIPTVWVTAPTTECHGAGYLINAPLDLDIGRSQVTWDSGVNSDRFKELGVALADALISLFDAGPVALGVSVEAKALWRSLWEILSKVGDRKELHDRLMWGESGAAREFYSKRRALPTGLTAERYDSLTMLENVKYAVTGVLDTDSAFLSVSNWESFREAFPPTTVVSAKLIGVRLPKPPKTIRMVDAIEKELSPQFIDPKAAQRLGYFLNRERLRAWDENGNEGEEVRRGLSKAQFRNSLNDWCSAVGLISLNAETDEARRAALAPPDQVLSPDYSDPFAIKFFLACRERLNADAATLADWVLAADTEDRQNAALRYLERGELGTQVRRELHRRGIVGTWLEQLTAEQMADAGLDAYEQQVLAAGLGPTFFTFPPPPLPPPQPTNLFETIAAWWHAQGTARIQEYDRRIYPNGRLPQLNPEGPGNVAASRVEWLKLFVTGIVQTVGRVTADQNREFVRLCETERWLATLANALEGPREWLASVERYIDRHQADGVRYYHWLRHFVGIATVSRHLNAYADSFLAIDRFEGRFTPRDLLTTRTSRQFQFGGPDAPTLTPILGIGACFVLRELARMGLVTREDVHPFCFPPVRRLRQLLESLGWNDQTDGAPHDRSQSIYAFIAEHYPKDPTFGGAFDIPLLMYVEEHPHAIETLRPSQNSGEWITLHDGRRVPLR